MSERTRKSQSISANNTAKQSSKSTTPNPGLDELVQRAIQSPDMQLLTAPVIQSIQKTHGNRFAQRLVDTARTTARTAITPAREQAPRIQKLQMHGQKANGKFGVLSADEMAAWITSKAGRAMNGSNVSQCVSYIMNHDGKGGGGINKTYKGKTVYHISHGQRGRGDGCSIFFANTDQDTVTIVAIGSHRGETSYDLDWVKDSWHNGVLKL